jgi:hypothetical protein
VAGAEEGADKSIFSLGFKMEASGLLGFLPCECQTVQEVTILGLFDSEDEGLIFFETSDKITSKPQYTIPESLNIQHHS